MMDFIYDNAGLITLLVLITTGILINLLYSEGRCLTNSYTTHLPINSGEHWPSPKIDSALARANFAQVRYDVMQRKYIAKSHSGIIPSKDLVEVRVIECQGRRQIRFTSQCAAPIRLLNWNKNKKNVQRFEKVYYGLVD